jgi:hypothetical protein
MLSCVSPAALMIRAGHSDFKTTQAYIGLAGETFRAEAELLETRLWGQRCNVSPIEISLANRPLCDVGARYLAVELDRHSPEVERDVALTLFCRKLTTWRHREHVPTERGRARGRLALGRSVELNRARDRRGYGRL